MLVLQRKANESVVIGDSIVVRILEVRGNRVRIGISAPADTRILRAELATAEQPVVPAAADKPRSVNRRPC